MSPVHLSEHLSLSSMWVWFLSFFVFTRETFSNTHTLTCTDLSVPRYVNFVPVLELCKSIIHLLYSLQGKKVETVYSYVGMGLFWDHITYNVNKMLNVQFIVLGKKCNYLGIYYRWKKGLILCDSMATFGVNNSPIWRSSLVSTNLGHDPVLSSPIRTRSCKFGFCLPWK